MTDFDICNLMTLKNTDSIEFIKFQEQRKLPSFEGKRIFSKHGLGELMDKARIYAGADFHCFSVSSSNYTVNSILIQSKFINSITHLK